MRIIGGSLGGRRFNPPADKWPTRPTTDMAKEALFNILHNSIDFESIKALDLFGGSGSQSFELVSRGCQDVTYVERHYPCIRFVKNQLKAFEATNYVHVVKSDVFRFMKSRSEQYDYIFCDPPYALDRIAEIPNLVFDNNLLSQDGLLVIEHDRKNDFEGHPRFDRSRVYGSTIFSFFG